MLIPADRKGGTKRRQHARAPKFRRQDSERRFINEMLAIFGSVAACTLEPRRTSGKTGASRHTSYGFHVARAEASGIFLTITALCGIDHRQMPIKTMMFA